MQSVLITGGAGFIGQNLVHAWRAARPDDRLVVVDAMTYAANVRSLEPLVADRSIAFVKGDIGDAALMRQLFDEQTLHQRGVADVARYELDAAIGNQRLQAADIGRIGHGIDHGQAVGRPRRPPCMH